MMGAIILSRRSVILGAGSLSACAGQPSKVVPRTLKILKAQDAGTLDPAFTATFNDLGPMDLLYERLARHEVVGGVPTGRVVGELAETWEPNADHSEWTVRLREDSHFDDGSPVDAAAVIFTQKRNLAANPALAEDSKLVTDAVALDARTVRYKLAAPIVIFPHFLAYPQSSVLNPKIMQHAEGGDWARAWLSQNSAGSGPYRLDTWRRGQIIRLKASGKARRKPVFFDTVEFLPIPDEGSRLSVFRKGGIDILEGVSLGNLARVAKTSRVAVEELPSPRWVGVVYNTKVLPLSDVRVRQALDAAIDRAGIIHGVMQGRAKPMPTALPPGVPGYAEGPIPPRDLATSRRLIAAAGYGQRRLKLALNLFKDDSAIEGTALALQANLAEVGVDLELRQITAAANLQAMESGQYQLAIVRTAPPVPDPWFVMDAAFRTTNAGSRGANFPAYGNREVDLLLDQAQFEQDPGKRLSEYNRVAQIIRRDVPISFLYSTSAFLVIGKDLSGANYSGWYPDQYDAAAMRRL